MVNSVTTLLHAAKSLIEVKNSIEKALELNIVCAVKKLQDGIGYVAFNDETGFPDWYSHASGKSHDIYAVKVNEEDRLLFFDYKIEPSEENLEDNDCWFDPYDDGEFNESCLIECIEECVHD